MSFTKQLTAALLLAPAMASAQPYLIAGVGTGSTDTDWVQAAFDPGAKADDDLQRAVIGMGVRANENLAVEAVYLSRAEATVEGSILGVPSRIDQEHQGLQVGLVASAPLTPQFAVFGKLTGNLLSIDMDTTMNGSTVMQDSDTGLWVGAGFGVQLQFNDRVGLRLGLERTFVSEFADYTDGDFDIDQASATLHFSL
jgi:hypothetical protein